MEDGPYRNTRASAGSLNRSSEKAGHYENENQDTHNLQNSEVFNHYSTPKSNEPVRVRNRTPSGHFLTNSVGDIRNFFDKTDTASPLNLRSKIVKDCLSLSTENRSTVNAGLKDSQSKVTSATKTLVIKWKR